ncbi:hypothetical protein, partial [Alicyclobacillus sp. SP_1]|uniref:AAA family ATPase n=1 Tax=Alicyclobacillus sp. SP_1 TaxID=2942475 RepID=UPI002158482C
GRIATERAMVGGDSHALHFWRVDESAGYIICYEIAKQNLKLGPEVVVDTVIPISEARQAWRVVAKSLNVPLLEIEVVCSDENEHRQRINSRVADIAGLALPTWDQVKNRHYEVWDRDHVIIDTAHKSGMESLEA